MSADNNDLNSPAAPNLSAEISALRSQVFVLLVALVIVTGTLMVYLYRQASVAGKEIVAIEPQAKLIVNAYNKNQPELLKFENALMAYGRTNPDFARKVLLKNHLAPAPGEPAKAPAPPKK